MIHTLPPASHGRDVIEYIVIEVTKKSIEKFLPNRQTKKRVNKYIVKWLISVDLNF